MNGNGMMCCTSRRQDGEKEEEVRPQQEEFAGQLECSPQNSSSRQRKVYNWDLVVDPAIKWASLVA